MEQKKNILLIVPKFYGYEKMISDHLKKIFENVYLIYENRDWVSLFHRFIYVYFPSKKRKILDKYFIKEINKITLPIDTVIVIRGSSLSEVIMNHMKNKFSNNCKYIMYQWDGIKNNIDVLEFSKSFDKICTFDIKDAKIYGWQYRPLFFNKEKIKFSEKDIDIAYLCSLHSQRAQILNKLREICKKNKYSLFFNMYCNMFAFLKWKYIGKKVEYISVENSNVSFKSLSLDQTYDLYSRSKIIVDYTHPNQTGFTMRTIEAIGNKCKLITNNNFIKQADFYNPANIYVYDGINVKVPNEFINSPYIDIDSSLYDYYSLEGWIDTLLSE